MKCQRNLPGHEWDFYPGFLHLVLAKENLAGPERFLNGSRRLRLGHRQQHDGSFIASGVPARRANPLLNGIEILGKTHAAIVDGKARIVNLIERLRRCSRVTLRPSV